MRNLSKKIICIENRITKIEKQIGNGEALFNIRSFLWGLLFFVFTLSGYVTYAVFMAFKKTLKLGIMDNDEKKKYFFKGEFSEFEYLWGRIGEK